MTRAADVERETMHRPWPLPAIPWIMCQGWRDLLFAHWPVPVGALRPRVPAPLEVETFGGAGWVGVVPFRLTGLRARYLPALPGVSEFPELNLRTYVRHGGRSGIYFFSLDAASRLAVAGARAFFRLPYHHADMSIEWSSGWLRYRSHRRRGVAEFTGRYRPAPTGAPFNAARGSLEHFLVERYALFVVLRSGRLLRGDIHHPPWVLEPAEAVIERETIAAAAGITLPDSAPVLHFSARQDALIWPPVSDAGT